VGIWYWKKEGDRHYFVEAVDRELKKLAQTPGTASAERNWPADTEARLLEEFVPKLEEALSKRDPEGKLKYIFLTPVLGTFWDKKVPRLWKVGGIFVAPYKRKPLWIRGEEVVDYNPAEYEPVKRAENPDYCLEDEENGFSENGFSP